MNMTDAAAAFFLEDESGYGFMCELLNSPLSNTEIVDNARHFFVLNFHIVTGNHISSKFFHHLMMEAFKQIDWQVVIAKCVALNS